MKGGPEYTLSFPNGDFRGSSYSIFLLGPTCSFASPWVKKLAAQPFTGRNKHVAHGPPGWHCVSDRAMSPANFPGMVTVLKGTCQNRRKTRSFGWSPFIGDAVKVPAATA